MTPKLPDTVRAVEDAFAFLVEDFGFVPEVPRSQRGGFELKFSKTEIGILIDWYPRDPITAWLVKLIDGGVFPPRGQQIVRADTHLHYFDLGHLAAMSGDLRQERELYAPSAENAALLAASLRTHAGSLLAGDPQLFVALEDYVKQRIRETTIAHYGEEYARTLGW